VYRPADPPRDGRVAFWDPADGPLPLGIGELATWELVVADAEGIRTRAVRVIELPITEAVPILGRARTDQLAHPSAAFWGAAALIALQLVARGRLLPGVSPADHDAWRVGPLDPADVDRILNLAEVMPPEARAVPLSAANSGELRLWAAEDLVRAFLDGVADGMPRSPAAVQAHGTSLFTAKTPQQASRLRSWADEVSAGLDTGVRISLRIEMADSLGFGAVVQLHSLKDPTLVRDASEVWAQDVAGFGPRARIDATLAIRRAARVWSPLTRLLDAVVPGSTRRLRSADTVMRTALVKGSAFSSQARSSSSSALITPPSAATRTSSTANCFLVSATYRPSR